MADVHALSMDALAEVRFVESAMRCLASPTMGNAARLGICLDLVANLRWFMEKYLLPSIEVEIDEHGGDDDAAWQAFYRLDKLIESLPEAEVEWIDTAVGALRDYDGD